MSKRIDDYNKYLKDVNDKSDLGYYELAYDYYYGVGVKKNINEAYKIAKMLNEKKYPKGVNFFGWMYYREKKYVKAIEIWLKGLDNTNCDVCYNIALCYACGTGYKINYIIAEEYALKAYNFGMKDVWIKLVNEMIFEDEDVKVINSIANIKAHQYMEKYLNDELENYYYVYALLYYNEKQYDKAISYAKLSGTSKNGDASAIISLIYIENKKIKEAIDWYKNGGAFGSSLCYYELGNIYFEGKLVKRDIKKATEYFLKCYKCCSYENNDDIKAAIKLVEIYEELMDYKNYVTWLFVLDYEGVVDCKIDLALAYMDGIGVIKNYNKMLERTKEAISYHNGYAMYLMGYFYEEGIGVDIDFDQALNYYQNAISYGYQNAKKEYSRLINKKLKQMTNDIIINNDLYKKFDKGYDCIKELLEKNIDFDYSKGLSIYYKGYDDIKPLDLIMEGIIDNNSNSYYDLANYFTQNDIMEFELYKHWLTIGVEANCENCLVDYGYLIMRNIIDGNPDEYFIKASTKSYQALYYLLIIDSVRYEELIKNSEIDCDFVYALKGYLCKKNMDIFEDDSDIYFDKVKNKRTFFQLGYNFININIDIAYLFFEIGESYNDSESILYKGLIHSGLLENKIGISKGITRKYRDYELAFSCFNKSESEEALYYLGICYELGFGTKNDIIKATECYRILSKVDDVEVTKSIAKSYFKKSNNHLCWYLLANIYFNERCIEKRNNALKHAIDLGSCIAYYELNKYPLKYQLEQELEEKARLGKYLDNDDERISSSIIVITPNNEIKVIELEADMYNFEKFFNTTTVDKIYGDAPNQICNIPLFVGYDPTSEIKRLAYNKFSTELYENNIFIYGNAVICINSEAGLLSFKGKKQINDVIEALKEKFQYLV